MKKTRTVMDGNAFYEIDEECMENRRQQTVRKIAAGRNSGGSDSKTGSGKDSERRERTGNGAQK